MIFGETKVKQYETFMHGFLEVLCILQLLLLLTLSSSALATGGNPQCNADSALPCNANFAGCLTNISVEPAHETDPGTILKLNPDQWRSPTCFFRCSGKARWDFTGYDVLEFHFRCPDPDPGNPSFQLRTFNQQSRVVKIREYISGGIIDDTFRLVSIPLSDLKTAEWDLGNVESLMWNSDPKRRNYYVKNLKLHAVKPPELLTTDGSAPTPESNTVIRACFNKRWREETVRQTRNYSLSSKSDFSYATPVNPSEVGCRFRVEGFSKSKVPRIRFSVFLRFPMPLKNGNAYTLHVEGVADEFCNPMDPADFAFTYDDTAQINTNIKINQVGYLTDAPKVGYVGAYVGDLGGLTWAVGENGTILSRTKAGGWKKEEVPVRSLLRAIAGLREDHVYCVGDSGVILHWNGSRWMRVDSPTNEDLLGASFGPTGIVWAVGKKGTTVRYENGKWFKVSCPVSTTLRAVWAGPGDTAWAVGDGGTILIWTGKQWSVERVPVTSDLLAIHGGQHDRLWVSGDQGTVLFRRLGMWSIFPLHTDSKPTFNSIVTGPEGEVLLGGDDGLLWYKRGSSDSGFESQSSGTTNSILGIARQNSRRMWAVDASGMILSFSDSKTGWAKESSSSTDKLSAIFSLPYGALRLPDPAPPVCITESSTGKTVMTVPLSLEAANWYLSGEDVFSFDFSLLKEPGTYFAHIPGLGNSFPFKIGPDVLEHAAYTTAHALYYQRCGIPLEEAYAEKRFSRPLDHEYEKNGRKIDAAYHESLTTSPLYAGETPGEMADGHGGWHDAGDYGKYVPTAAAALWHLFTAYDINPDKFTDGTWNIPESGNGVPDILDEARWEVDWLARMQRSDGAVYHKLTSQKWFEGMPQAEVGPRYFFESTTHDTASAAAVFACAARLWKPFDEKTSDSYLRKAEKAWNFLKEHPKEMPTGGFRNPPGNTTGEYKDQEDEDNRLWAAAELYRTTGAAHYREYFESWWNTNPDHPSGWNNWRHFYRCAYWAYLKSEWPLPDDRFKKEIMERILRQAEEIVQLTLSNPYRNGAKLDVPAWIGWGEFTQSSRYAFPLLQAWSLVKDDRYLRAALLNLDAQLGANPLSLCFVTGLGSIAPRDPLHHPSLHDGEKDPIPGIPVFGAAAHLPNNQPYYIMSQEDLNSFPPSKDTKDPYPILRRYIDAHELVPMSEFTIVNIAVTTAVLHLMSPSR